MTTVELMDNLSDYLRSVIVDYSTQQPSGKRSIKVYAGYPPARMNADEQASFYRCAGYCGWRYEYSNGRNWL